MSNRSISGEMTVAASQYMKERQYWLNKLSGDLVISHFPYDFENTAINKPKIDSCQVNLPAELNSRIIKAMNQSDSRLLMILAAGLIFLLNKYTGNQDLLVSMPIDKQKISGNFLNTVLVLRTFLENNMIFRQLLMQVKQVIVEASEHQNYPLEKIHYELNMPDTPDGGFPLADIALLLENIQDRQYLKHINFNMVFSFSRQGEYIDGAVYYNSLIFQKATLERIIAHYINLLHNALLNPNSKLSSIDLLSGQEKRQLLFDFNNTEAEYPEDKTIQQLFEARVEKTPGNTAALYEEEQITYLELNKKANDFAWLLRKKGVRQNTIIAMMGQRSIAMLIGIVGILKSGGAYLPINGIEPDERIRYILKDSKAHIFLSQEHIIEKNKSISQIISPQNILLIDDLAPGPGTTAALGKSVNPGIITKPADAAYVIYTSGTTGRPKGVIIPHRGLVNYICWAAKTYVKNERVNFPLYTSISFDLTVTSMFTPLITGNAVVIYGGWDKEPLISKIIDENKVEVIKITPSHLKLAKDKKIKHSRIRRFIVGGEDLDTQLAKTIHDNFKGNIEIYNEYGPTEASVGCMIYQFNPERDKRTSIPIGVPADNVQVYILDKNQQLLPRGAGGEIYISGDGVARGYLSRPELTKEKFVPNPFIKDKIMYRTGDLAVILPDGNMEFLGRLDHQVKVRGFRIELGEIDSKLLDHEEIKEVITIAKSDEKRGPYMCAYFIAARELAPAEPREYLSKKLPDYMIPSYFVQIDKIPLTPNGKVDTPALPAIEIKREKEYTAPRNRLERHLAKMWSDILGINQRDIGIDTNFFQLGGHSLSATTLELRINKELNVKVPLTAIFSAPTIREMTEYVKGQKRELFSFIELAEEKEYYGLSSAQKRLYIMQQMDPGVTNYHIASVKIIEGNLDRKRLEETFKKLIYRHESLRTSFHILENQPAQVIHDRVDFSVDYWEVNEEEAGERLKRFIKPFDLSTAPLLQVGCIKVKEEKYMLALDMHHIISDAFSMQVFIEDFLALYTGEKLPPLKLHYRDYSEWQNQKKQKESIEQQKKYWLRELEGELPVLDLPTDFVRPEVQSFEGSILSFEIDIEEIRGLNNLSVTEGTTLYMVLLSIFNVLLSKISNQEEIVIGSVTAGRRHSDLENIIGMFVNTLPLLNYPGRKQTFTSFLSDVRDRTLEAFENQDYPFEELVDQVLVNRDVSRNPIFDVMFVLQNIDTPRVEMSGLTLAPYKYETQKTNFDLALQVQEAEDKLVCSFDYCTRLFKKESVERIISFFKKTVSSILENPGIMIPEIQVISEEEKKRVLYKFNNTEIEYPKEMTIHELFEEEVAKTPDHIALLEQIPKQEGTGRLATLYITYRELNEKSNRLALSLKEKGVKPDTIVGIMVERSVRMIIGIMGILKSGGAYLPIDPEYPRERINYMLSDSQAKILLTNREIADFSSPKAFSNLSEGRNLTNDQCPMTSDQLAYVIYTSGSTGRPKGVMVEHHNVLRLVKNANYIHFSPRDQLLPTGSAAFDITTFEIWGPLLNGAALVLASKDVILNAAKLNEVLVNHDISILHLIPQLFNQMAARDIDLFGGLRYFLVGGDLVRPGYINKLRQRYSHLNILHMYGPTENTTFSTFFLVDRDYEYNIPIGSPISNSTVYILDKYSHLQPVGIMGELCVGGEGIARGYMNNPVLTAEKFKRTVNGHLSLVIKEPKRTVISHSSLVNGESKRAVIGHSSLVISPSEKLSKVTNDRSQKFPPNDQCPMTNDRSSKLATNDQCLMINDRLYRTGDLARRLPDGNIEFLGRIDQQVKIRGFRIELGEIESLLSGHEAIKEAVVKAAEDNRGDRYLCAYFVSARDLSASELVEYLAGNLPRYMIPAYFVPLEEMPLTPNGKVNIRELPEPEIKAAEEYEPPQGEIEKKLLRIWSDVLGTGENVIGRDANFFELGGHSLKATITISRIRKEFNVLVPMQEFFKQPVIKGLAGYIKLAAPGRYKSIEPVEEKEYYPLSSQQLRLFSHQERNPGSTVYNITAVVEFEGGITAANWKDILRKLVKRHESLRSSFDMIENEPIQRIHREVELEVDYYTVENEAAQIERSEKIRKILKRFVRAFDLRQAPLLQAGLIKIGEKKYIFILDIHHIITDGTSNLIFTQELISVREGKELPPLKIHYKDYSEGLNRGRKQEVLRNQKKYWLKQFEGDLPILDLPIDFKRPSIQNFEGRMINFEVCQERTKALKSLANEQGVTLYTLLLTIYYILLFKLSHQEDIIIGTPVAGRTHAELEGIIGFFINTLALRNFPRKEKTFKAFLKEVKERTLEAFENQDYQFEDLVKQVLFARDTSRNPLFDTMLVWHNMEVPGTRMTGLDLKPYAHEIETSMFDLTLFGNETNHRLNFLFQYNIKLFKEETIRRFGNYFQEIVSSILENKEVELAGIKLSHDFIASTSKKPTIEFSF